MRKWDADSHQQLSFYHSLLSQLPLFSVAMCPHFTEKDVTSFRAS